MIADSDDQGRPQNKMVGCFNITTSLDHLDYDCIVVAGSVHVLGQCAKWSFRHEVKAFFSLPVSPRNESIPQSVPCFTVGLSKQPTDVQYSFSIIFRNFYFCKQY